jgi:hypothetical protein
MLGFGALGEYAIGEIPGTVLALTQDILQAIVTEFVNERKLEPRPAELHHFTSLDVAHLIVKGDDVRLSHAEYSNDQTEMEQAKRVIADRLNNRSGSDPFFGQVSTRYQNLAPNLDAFIFCMCTGLQTGSGNSPDILSQWRAYGQDGRGMCLTLDASRLSRLVENTPGLRINPVIYDQLTQISFVDAILDRAYNAHRAGTPNAIDAAVAALVYTTPLMKASGFSEEREWRLIFMPPSGVTPQLEFHSRRDFLAPFIKLHDLWFNLRPTMMTDPVLAGSLPRPPVAALVPPLVPVTRIMVGPSGHATLTRRAMLKLLAQTHAMAGIPVEISAIPYRSLA